MRSSVRSNRSDGYSGSPKPSQARTGGMLPIDERPKRRYKKKRAKGGVMAVNYTMAEPTDAQEQELGEADEEAANEINE